MKYALAVLIVLFLVAGLARVSEAVWDPDWPRSYENNPDSVLVMVVKQDIPAWSDTGSSKEGVTVLGAGENYRVFWLEDDWVKIYYLDKLVWVENDPRFVGVKMVETSQYCGHVRLIKRFIIPVLVVLALCFFLSTFHAKKPEDLD